MYLFIFNYFILMGQTDEKIRFWWMNTPYIFRMLKFVIVTFLAFFRILLFAFAFCYLHISQLRTFDEFALIF